MTKSVANVLAIAWPSSAQMVWTLLLLASVALIVLLRTRLRNLKPWCKCAILSLWAHVLLAGLAMTVSIISGGPGVGPESRIRVVYVAAATPPPDADSEKPSDAEQANPLPPLPQDVSPPPTQPPPVPPATLSHDELSPDAQQSAPTPSLVSPPGPKVDVVEPLAPLASQAPLAAPELIEIQPDAENNLPVENKSAAAEKTDGAEPKSKSDDPLALVAASSRSADSPGADRSPLSPAASILQQDALSPLTSTPRSPDESAAETAAEDPAMEPSASAPKSSPRSAVSPVFARRFAPHRSEWIANRGGNGRTERSVKSALAWLAGAQDEHGLWIASRFGAGQERRILGHDRRGAGAGADAGVTGLALLAMLGAGHSTHHGEYAMHVQRGVDGLRRVQRRDGALYGDASDFAQMYCHAMATFALAEACAMSGDDALRPAVEAAVAFSLRAQSQRDGGWRYKPGDSGDTSQLGWQLMALKSAELAGVAVPDDAWARAERFLQLVERGMSGGLAAYRPDGPPSRTMTAEGLYCRQLTAHRRRSTVSKTAAQEAAASLLRELPGARDVNLYYWYYATLALSQARDVWPEATTAWDAWNAALVPALLESQSADGSWPTTTVWGGYGGKVYTTSMAALTLEVYYRYDDASRPP